MSNSSQYRNVLNLISRRPQDRTTMECQELVAWLKGRSRLFADVKYNILTEIIRHCTFEIRETDDIVIKQGERGDKLYIALHGAIDIYVNQKESFSTTDNEAINTEILEMVTKAAQMSELDRNLLGAWVFGGSCLTFGEVALVEQDCIRTATVVANTHVDLLTIDRDLFDRCLRGAVTEDMKAKWDFVDRNPMFETWPQRHKKQLVISMSTEKVSYGNKIVKQGAESDIVYFISSGEVGIQLEPRRYKTQYPSIWSDIETLFADLVPKREGITLKPHQDRINRLTPQKPQQICVLGENEHLGCMEMMLGLDTFLETAIARSTVTLLKLRRQQFDRIFKRRYAAATLDTLKDNLAQRLCLYICQCPTTDSAFLKFLNIRLADPVHLKKLRKTMYEIHDDVFNTASTTDSQTEKSQTTLDLRKLLHVPRGKTISLPTKGLSEVILSDMNKRLKAWSQNCKLNGFKLFRILL